MYTTLITPQQLANRGTDSDWLIVDCRADLTRPDAGQLAYGAGHIPGAVFADLNNDLSSPITPASGRHPLPDMQAWIDTLRRWGLRPDTQVVAYDADNGMFASRLWWMLRWAGHRAVAVLDGGYRGWSAAALPIATEATQRTRSDYSPQTSLVASSDRSEVGKRVQQSDWRVLDARAPERFAGSVEPIDAVAGHVPGARNHPFGSNLDSDGRFLPPDELRRRLTASLDGVDAKQTIAMCGSGVTACHLLLALEVAGIEGAQLYPGSWSEWIRDPQSPVARNT